MKQRSETTRRLAASSYDVCVIGGGATGAGCALDAQLRGLKTVLLDAGDFGSATSSASTKLIHGGLRYLQQAVMELDASHYRLVRQALHERHLMMRNAPNLVRTRHFAIPCFSLLDAVYYDVGSKLYDWLAGESSLSSSRWVSRANSLAVMPCLQPQGLQGTVVYSDGQFDDARYNLALVQSCAAAGGDALNYAPVIGFDSNDQGRVIAAIVKDAESGARIRVSAKAFVNATGPFSDRVRRLDDPDAKERLRLSRGVHILLPLPEDFGNHALLIPKTEDKRLMFAIPWQGRLLVGTTETESDLNEEMIVTRGEAEYLLRHLSRYLSRTLQLSDIVSAMVGVRPLVRSADRRNTTKLSRDYEIEVSRSGLISILGGKWTVYRAMAEDAVNAVQQAVTGRTTACLTRAHPLFGSLPESGDGYAGEAAALARANGITRETASHLVQKFGTRAGRVLDLAQEDASLLASLVEGAPQIQAEVVYSVREEMAVSLEDVLSRRLGLQYFDWRLAAQAAPAAAGILARELGWCADRARSEVGSYTELISRYLTMLGLDGVPTATLN
jgi:glycerol-3-phosphate dehydrogenase